MSPIHVFSKETPRMVSRTSFRAGLTGLALMLLALLAPLVVHAADDSALRSLLMQFREAADFTEKTALVEKLAAQDHPRTAILLKALADSRLYYQADGDRVVIGLNDAPEMTIEDAVSGEALGQTGKRELDRVTANNRLRAMIENLLASLGLASADPQTTQGRCGVLSAQSRPGGRGTAEGAAGSRTG